MVVFSGQIKELISGIYSQLVTYLGNDMIKIIFVLLTLFFSQAILAQSGIYITSESGWANQTGLPSASNAQAQSIKQSNFPILHLSIGYLHDFQWLNDKFGLGFEAGGGLYRGSTYYFSSGKKVDTYSKTLEFLAVLSWHLQPLDLFVKAGGIRHTLTNFSALSNSSSRDDTKIQPEVTAGINYNFNTHFALTSEYLHTFGSNIDNFNNQELQCPSLNAVLVGIRVAFW